MSAKEDARRIVEAMPRIIELDGRLYLAHHHGDTIECIEEIDRWTTAGMTGQTDLYLWEVPEDLRPTCFRRTEEPAPRPQAPAPVCPLILRGPQEPYEILGEVQVAFNLAAAT